MALGSQGSAKTRTTQRVPTYLCAFKLIRLRTHHSYSTLGLDLGAGFAFKAIKSKTTRRRAAERSWLFSPIRLVFRGRPNWFGFGELLAGSITGKEVLFAVFAHKHICNSWNWKQIERGNLRVGEIVQNSFDFIHALETGQILNCTLLPFILLKSKLSTARILGKSYS